MNTKGISITGVPYNDPEICIKDMESTFVCVCPECKKEMDDLTSISSMKEKTKVEKESYADGYNYGLSHGVGSRKQIEQETAREIREVVERRLEREKNTYHELKTKIGYDHNKCDNDMRIKIYTEFSTYLKEKYNLF